MVLTLAFFFCATDTAAFFPDAFVDLDFVGVFLTACFFTDEVLALVGALALVLGVVLAIVMEVKLMSRGCMI